MKATTILHKIASNPDLANYFGVSDNLDLAAMFGQNTLTGKYPTGAYAFFWCDVCPVPCPDFVLNVEGNKDRVYGYFID